MKLDERALLEKVRKANQAVRQGDPLKDFLVDDEIVDALQLLEDLVPRLTP